MKLNRKWLMVIALVLSLTMATAGTLAYLTDRDTVKNTFTMGNVDIEVDEEYEQDSELYPGVEVEKEAGIKNVHATSDAWVWMTVSVPTELVDYIDLEWLAGTNVDATTRTDVHEGYTSFVVKHPEVLKAGESTDKYLQGVTLSELVDYQDGSYGYVENGVFEPLNGLDDLKIIVDGFAVQTEGFDTVLEAYKAYEKQWEEMGNGGESGANGGPEPANGDDDSVTYDVPAGAVTVTSAEELAEQIANGETVFLLKAGTYHVPAECKNKTLTLVGEDLENTILEIVPSGQGEAGGQLDYGFDGSTVTFQNLTIKTNNATYAGYARLTGTYKNVNFDQQYCLQRDSVFEYCTFNVSGDQYNIWTWGAPTATFDHCTFNSDGKALLLYGETDNKVVLSNCVFNDTGVLTAMKAAVEVGSHNSCKRELIADNVDVNGYEINDTGYNTGTTLWGNKNSMGTDLLNVVVDDVDVY